MFVGISPIYRDATYRTRLAGLDISQYVRLTWYIFALGTISLRDLSLSLSTFCAKVFKTFATFHNALLTQTEPCNCITPHAESFRHLSYAVFVYLYFRICALDTREYHFSYPWTIFFSKIYHMLGLSCTLSCFGFVYLCICAPVFLHLCMRDLGISVQMSSDLGL